MINTYSNISTASIGSSTVVKWELSVPRFMLLKGIQIFLSVGVLIWPPAREPASCSQGSQFMWTFARPTTESRILDCTQ